MSNSLPYKFFVLALCQTCWPCTLEDIPYAVTLRVLTKAGLEQVCAGTLLQSRWVLTAAHCVLQDPSILRVMALVSPPDRFQVSSVAEAFTTDYYDPKTQENDVALLYTAHAFPPALPFALLPAANYTETCRRPSVVTWLERRLPQAPSMSPFCFDVTKVNASLCVNVFRSIADPATMLCAAANAVPCRGDSGGPLLCGQVVIGVISWGVDCKEGVAPSMFARVDASLDFIKNTLLKKETKLTLREDSSFAVLPVKRKSGKSGGGRRRTSVWFVVSLLAVLCLSD